MATNYQYKISNIPVVYEDDWLLVLDKPAGLLTIPTPKKEKRTLTSILNDYLKRQGLSYRLHPCHRLDRETSGLIIYAKGKSAQAKMMQEFKEQRVKKTYLAFIRGKILPLEGEIKNSIAGIPASTRYQVISQRQNFSLVRINPLTGRTNQIRIHFKQRGHPLLGETKYALRRDFILHPKRLCLQAQELEFPHPYTKKMVHLKINLAEDLKKFLSAHV